ncbi:hypothetical protein IFM89_006945 [Coptis chinensis]|uniref:Ribosomal protein S21 n=1 Tax=Coptis chinensis TaxID=261450 RepID=A0A835LHR4_9MAGN|nr:hypothetical protein IFM89_006945 [Coptis chinensis]
MNTVGKQVWGFMRNPSVVTLSSVNQQWRGIKMRVGDRRLEQVLIIMERKMKTSGMERLIKNRETHHLKNSEKKIIARKNLQLRLKSQDLARKLQSILIKKVRVCAAGAFETALKESLLDCDLLI